MDLIDRNIVIQLLHDPRITYRELSDLLDISVPTAQRRVEHLFESGRIRSLRYRLAIDALGGKWAFFYGQARVKLTPDVLRRLQEHGSVNRVLQCTYNFIVCHVDLRRESDLKDVLEFLMDRLDMIEPKVIIFSSKACGGGLLRYRRETKERGATSELTMLSSSDMRIVQQLCLDGRMPISSIAHETGLTARTVKRRIDHMVESGLIDGEMDFYLGVGGDLWFAMYVRFEHPSAKEQFFALAAKYDGNLFTGGWDFSNAMDLITFDGMFESLTEVHEVVSSLAQLEEVVETNHVVVHMSYLFDTWVHRMSRGEEPLPGNVREVSKKDADRLER